MNIAWKGRNYRRDKSWELWSIRSCDVKKQCGRKGVHAGEGDAREGEKGKGRELFAFLSRLL